MFCICVKVCSLVVVDLEDQDTLGGNTKALLSNMYSSNMALKWTLPHLLRICGLHRDNLKSRRQEA